MPFYAHVYVAGTCSHEAGAYPPLSELQLQLEEQLSLPSGPPPFPWENRSTAAPGGSDAGWVGEQQDMLCDAYCFGCQL